MTRKRVLHTADWHLGQSFHGFDRAFEHTRFLEWLLARVEEHEVDALFIAGDLFDTVNPPNAAVRQFNDFLGTLLRRRPSCEVVAIAGNHDSASRIDSSSALTGALGLHVLGAVRTAEGRFDPARLVVPLGARDGAEPWGHAAAIPFLRSDDLGTLTELTEGDAYERLLRRRHEAVFEALAQVSGPTHARFALAHGVVLGEARRSEESERDVRIGTVEGVPADVFPADLTYVALGHLHRPQRAGGRTHMQYAGSPLPLHVSEADYAHRAVLVTVEGRDLVSIDDLLVPKTVEVVRVPGRGRALGAEETLAALRALPDASKRAPEVRPYLEVRVALEGPRANFVTEVLAALEHRGYRLTTVRVEQAAADTLMPTNEGAAADLDDFTPEEVLQRLHALHFGGAEPSAALRSAFATLLDEVRGVEVVR